MPWPTCRGREPIGTPPSFTSTSRAAPPRWRRRACSRPSPAPVDVTARDLTITIVSGTAEQATYVFTLPRVNLGRCAEVRDSLSRLVRSNHVAFVDLAGTANHSVSRRHAHIECVEASRQLPDSGRSQRTWDERRAQRADRTVPAGSRGIRLESGDEIVLGEARARVRIGD